MLRRISLFLLALALLAGPAAAQDTFFWEPLSLEKTVPLDSVDVKFNVTLTNTTNDDRTYVLHFLTPDGEPATMADQPDPGIEGWSRAFCTHGICAWWGLPSVNDDLAGGETDPDCYVQLSFFHDDTTFYVPVRVYDTEFPDDYVETTFTLHVGMGSDVDDDPRAAEPAVTYTLAPVYPNPFNAAATVRFELQRPGDAALTLHDVTGRQVLELARGMHGAGRHVVSLDASTLASGTYYVRLMAGGQQFMVPATVLK